MSLLYWDTYVRIVVVQIMPGAPWLYDTTPPARFAAVESRRVREGGVALPGYFSEPTVHHTLGSLMHVGIYYCLHFHDLHAY